MKLTKGLFMACASLALFACSNEDTPMEDNLNNGETQSIAIKLEGLTTDNGGRALGENTVADQAAATFDNIVILCSDGTNILKVERMQSADEDWGELSTANGHFIHNVPASVREVYAIGNYDSASDLNTWVTGLNEDNPSTTNAIMNAKVIKAAEQQTFADVTLFGVDQELATANPADDQTEGHNKVLNADITIKPLVSRIEISQISCTDLGTSFSKIDLKYIGLMNYFNQTTLGGNATGQRTIAEVVEPSITTPEEGKISWGEAVASVDDSWAWDKFTSNISLTNTSKVHKATEGKAVAFYQFIPKKVGSTNFNVKLYVAATEKTSGQVSALNTVTANFTGDNNFKYEPGMVYKVSLDFTEKNLGPWDPSEIICVNVIVKAQPWTVKQLTVTYE